MHTLPPLPYTYDALEPVIDVMTMQIHHTRHHQTYIDKLNAWLSTYPSYESWSVRDLLIKIKELPDSLQGVVRNHAWWHHNHSLFWKIMKPAQENNRLTAWSAIEQAIINTFWSFEVFQSQFSDKAVGYFGSGWCWLVQFDEMSHPLGKGGLGGFEIITTTNQDSPLMNGKIPLLWLDLWEHAYYLHYQNKRADYISARWSLVNWDEVEKNFSTLGMGSK
jgi:Fe-Mn family superoxide dismutase